MSVLIGIDPDLTASLPWISQEITLDGAQYTLELAWNSCASQWAFSLYANDGTPLVIGRTLVVGFPLLRQYVVAGLPPGSLIAVDTSGAGEEIAAQEDLGARVSLVYLSADEV